MFDHWTDTDRLLMNLVALACLCVVAGAVLGRLIDLARERSNDRRPHFPPMPDQRSQQRSEIVKGTDRLRAGYQQGRDWGTR